MKNNLKTYMQQYVADYINGDNKYDAGLGLAQELDEFCHKHDLQLSGSKAYRIYVKCLARRKVALAQRIKDKYYDQFPKPDDTSIALGLALCTVRRHKKS